MTTLATWSERMAPMDADMSEGTRLLRATTVAWMRRYFGRRDISTMTREDAAGFAAWLAQQNNGRGGTLARATVSKIVRDAKAIMARAVDADVMTRNPFAGVSVTGTDAAPWPLVSRATVELVMARCESPEWRCLIALCRYAGLRRGEALRLWWEHVEGKTLRVYPENGVETTKQRYRSVPIEPRLAQVLDDARRYGKQEDRVVGIMDPLSVNQIMRRYMREAGVEQWPKPFHTLRKNLVSEWVAIPGVPITDVSLWTGHSLEVLMRHYVKTLPQSAALVTG